MFMYRIIKLELYLSTCIKVNYKWIKDISKKPETPELLEENIVSILHGIGVEKDFLNRTPIAQELKNGI